MNEFTVGEKLRIWFGVGVKEATVVRFKGGRWTVSVDLGGRHPFNAAMSPRQLQAAIDKVEES